MIKAVSIAALACAALSCNKLHKDASPDAAPSASSPGATPAATTAAPAAAACAPAGKYRATVNTGHGSGTSDSELDANGHFKIAVTLAANHATTTLEGTYTTSGNEITFVNTSGSASNGAHINPCVGVKGVYTMGFSADCKHLTLTKVSDSCPPREQEVAGAALERQ